MKTRIIVLLLATGLFWSAQAQTSWTTDAPSTSVYLTNSTYKVGIGVNTPLEKLHINGAIRGNSTGGALRINTGNGYIDLGPQNANWAHFSTDRAGFLFTSTIFLSTGLLSSSAGTDLKFQTGGSTQLTISNTSGQIGLGTAAPLAKLHVSGQMLLDDPAPTFYIGTASTDQNKFLQLSNSPLLSVPAGLKSSGILVADAYNYANPDKNTLIVKDKVGIGNTLASNPNGYSLWVNGKVNANSFYINDQIVVSSQWVTSGTNVYFSGNVGIGTNLNDNPKNYQLAVNGKIGAKDVRVENSSTTWPDYVFESAYVLPPLSKVKEYIDQNSHLMGVPSAEEVKNNGHELGEMDAILLKKIEELTLYLIELKSENQELTKRLENMERRAKLKR